MIRGSVEDAYVETDRERRVDEPAKRVPAPERTAFERDRARVVHSAALRRLAAKTQVVGPGSDDFIRNRLTHSLEVAQIARDVAHVLGCHPDLAETAALAHDLGHPPFGHNGERALDEVAWDCGGFEGNAQTLRILTRLEAKSADAEGAPAGLNLTRATLDACTKYPWRRGEGPAATGPKFGVYADEEPVFVWMRRGVEGTRRCVEAQVMDLADDVAYSVHDLEDGVVAGRIDLIALEDPGVRREVWATTREWYLPGVEDARLEEVFSGLRAVGSWPDGRRGGGHDGDRAALAALKNLTSDLIGIFCGHVQAATRAAYGEGPLVRHTRDVEVVVPAETALQIALLKGVAAHWVMSATDRVALLERQRTMLHELVAVLARSPEALAPEFAADLAGAGGDVAARRVVVDQVASLTDLSAVAWHARLCR